MSGVTFERLPPERRIAAPAAASAGSCCCCCCCCLHTVGSLIGAASAKPPKPPEGGVPTAVIGTTSIEPIYTVAKEYWATLLVMSLVAFPILIVSTGTDVRNGGEWALIYALVMPAIQLGTSVVVGVRNAFSKRPGKDQRLHHLGIITVRAFLGGLIGVLVMLVWFKLM